MSATVALLLIFAVALVNGYTDAPSSVATALYTGAVRSRYAFLLCAVFNFFGVIIAYSLCPGISDFTFSLTKDTAGVGVCICLGCVALFGVVTSLLGLPSSESHALISSACGVAFATNFDAKALKTLGYVFVFTVFSSTLALLLSTLTARLFDKSKGTAHTQICSLAVSSFMHGWQDGLKLIGIALSLGTTHILPSVLALLTALTVALGSLIGSDKIAKTLGAGLTELTPQSALCAELGSYLTLGVFSVFGIPLSTGNVKSLAIVGAGLGKGQKINKKAAFKVVLTSVATFPICFFVCYFVAKLL